MAVLAAVVIVVLVWVILRQGGAGDRTPAADASSSTTGPSATPDVEASTDPTPATASPSASPAATYPAAVWGDHPPHNLDALKDLDSPAYPETVGGFTLDGTSGRGASYVGPGYGTVDVTVLEDTAHYAALVSGLTDPRYVENAVCGKEVVNPGQFTCVLAGEGTTLWVTTTSLRVSVNDFAATVNDLYDAL